MNTISAVIITLNEEKNIERCLESLKEIADEIIVVDSFSTDKTKEICTNYEVKFAERKWEGYSNTKNYANSLAQSDYILSLDADESLSPELELSLVNFKNCEEPKTVYRFNRLTNYCGRWIKHGGWYPDKVTRLWKNKAATWKGEIHEHLSLYSDAIYGELKGDLYHYSFHTINQHIEQINKFTEIAAAKDFKRGRRTNLMKILVFPKWKFLRDYIIKLGFLDGYYGYLVCKNSAYASFLKYIKLRELSRHN